MMRLAGALLLLALGSASQVDAQQAAALDERQVKAAFLLNFAKFVQWPSAADASLVIAVTGDDALGELLERLVRDRSLGGRTIVARRVSASDDLADCDILYFGDLRPRDAGEMLSRVRGPVLTIGESVQFVRDGGMVRFYVENNRMRFHINQKNAEAAGLKISSQLLTLSSR